QDLLGREVDPSGFVGWTGFLDRGVSRALVIQGIESSPEYRTRTVQGLYATLLGRAADPAGLNGSPVFLARGGTLDQLRAILLSSPEYYQARGGGTNDGFLAALYHDVLGRPPDIGGALAYGQALARGLSRFQVASIVLGSHEARQQQVQGFY